VARMKARVEHRVPLARQAVAILHGLHGERESGNDHAGQREGSPLSNMALLMMQRRMKREEITAHGFRSTFSDWASDVSSFSGELRETALAHTIQNKSEQAYRRGDALERRRQMMESWANWCGPRPELDAGSDGAGRSDVTAGAKTNG
jgi:integrase